MSLRSAVKNWVDERFGWETITGPLRHKSVPHHRLSYWYFLGGMTLFLFTIQVITGALLLLYYRPDASQAFESVQFIMTKVQFGWLVRSIHSWSANLLIFIVFTHLFSVLFLKSYRKPRELTWVTGVLLLFLILGFGFTGYLLPWNTLSYFATKVGTAIPGQLPIIGHPLMVFMRGGDNVTGATLNRMFGFHVAILPALATLLVVLHLGMIQWFGISVPPKVEKEWEQAPEKRRDMRFFPNFALRELMAWYVALAILGALAALFPWNLGVKANPFASAPAGIKPEWYFLFMFQTLRLIPSKIFGIEGELYGIVGFGVLALGALLVPFLDRKKPFNTSRWITVAGILVLLFMVTMTLYGHFAR